MFLTVMPLQWLKRYVEGDVPGSIETLTTLFKKDTDNLKEPGEPNQRTIGAVTNSYVIGATT